MLPPEQDLLDRGPSVTWTADGQYAAFYTGDNSQYVDIMGINGKAYNITPLGERIERQSMRWDGDVFYFVRWNTTDLIAFYPDQNRYQTVKDSKHSTLNGDQSDSANNPATKPSPSGNPLDASIDASNILHITDANGTEVKTIPLSDSETLLGGWEWCP